MKVMWKAACAAVLIVAACSIEIGCGETYRPIAVPLPVTTGNPTGAETEVVLNTSPLNITPPANSVLTTINVSGDTNSGNKVLNNMVGNAMEGAAGNVIGNVASSIALDASRTSVFTANTSTDSVTQVLLPSSTAGFAATTNTISLDPGSQPIAMSFEYFGTTYLQDYVVNANLGTTAVPVPPATSTRTCQTGGSLGVITQATAELKATVCLASATNPNPTPVFAWIYKDQSKVFVLDDTPNQSANLVYVVSASKYKVTNTISVGMNPIKATQSADGNYIYVLNSGGAGSISIIDGQAETVVGAAVPTSNPLSIAPPIDIQQDLQFNRIWVLQSDGTVSIYNATTPGQLTWITSVATGANPTNLAVMRDGTQAYVGLGSTNQIVAISASKFLQGAVTMNASTSITVDLHRGSAANPLTQTLQDLNGVSHTVPVEVTTPMVNYVAVSRDNTKAYATATTTTIYNCYDNNVIPTDCQNQSPSDGAPYLVSGCTDLTGNQMSCLNLYNGTAVMTAVGNGTTPINSFITTIPAPSVVTYCTPAAGVYDGQKNCPAMVPVMVVGRS